MGAKKGSTMFTIAHFVISLVVPPLSSNTTQDQALLRPFFPEFFYSGPSGSRPMHPCFSCPAKSRH